MHPLKKARRLSIVPRWSIIPTIRQQNVAEHSFQVAVLTKYLLKFHEDATDNHFTREALSYALEHDEEEAVKGDMPGGPVIKRDFKALTSERGQVWAVVKMADMLEAMIFLEEEVALGNEQVMPIIDGYEKDVERLNEYIAWDIPASRMRRVLKDIIEDSLGLAMGDFTNGS